MCADKVTGTLMLDNSWIIKFQKFVGEQIICPDMGIADEANLAWNANCRT